MEGARWRLAVSSLRAAAGGTAGGLNGAAFLNAMMVHDDGASDTLTGSPTSLDWFFASALGQDLVKNWRTGEVITSIN